MQSSEEIAKMIIENAVILYAISIGKLKPTQAKDFDASKFYILDKDEKPLKFVDDEERQGLMHQMTVWVAAGYETYGVKYINGILKNKKYSQQVIAGALDLLSEYSGEVERLISINEKLSKTLIDNGIEVPKFEEDEVITDKNVLPGVEENKELKGLE